jgi:hypothetical protein
MRVCSIVVFDSHQFLRAETLGALYFGMAPLRNSLLTSILFAFLGVSYFLLGSSILSSFTEQLLESTCAERSARALTRVSGADSFLCLIVTVTQAAANHPSGVIVFGELLFLLLVYILLSGLESSRLGAKGPIAAFPLIHLVSQTLGACVSLPLVWLPSFLLSGVGNRSPENAARKTISRGRVEAIVTVAFAWLAVALTTFAVGPETQWATILYNILLSIVAPAFWFPFHSLPKSNAQQGERAAVAGYLLAAGAALAWRGFTFVRLIRDPSPFSQLVAVLKSPSSSETGPSVAFHVFDFFALFASFVLLALLEDGWVVALGTAAGGFVLGPAPAAGLYCAYRERQIEKAVKRGAEIGKQE